MTLETPIRILQVEPEWLPAPATPGSAAFDLRACGSAHLTIDPGDYKRIGTGLVVALPPGTAMLILPRSSLGPVKGLIILNSPGLIDPDFRGEIQLLLYNIRKTPAFIVPGERLAQGLLVPFLVPKWEPVPGLEDLGLTDRGNGGFGSTGQA